MKMKFSLKKHLKFCKGLRSICQKCHEKDRLNEVCDMFRDKRNQIPILTKTETVNQPFQEIANLLIIVDLDFFNVLQGVVRFPMKTQMHTAVTKASTFKKLNKVRIMIDTGSTYNAFNDVKFFIT